MGREMAGTRATFLSRSAGWGLAVGLAAGTLAMSGPATQARPTAPDFEVNEIYSNGDGSVQFLELRIAGHAAAKRRPILDIVSSPSDVSHPVSTSTTRARHAAPSSRQALRLRPQIKEEPQHILLATAKFVAQTGLRPDRVMPAGFLHPNGGTIMLSSGDRMSYGPLPLGGGSSLGRAGDVQRGTPTNSRGQTASIFDAAIFPQTGWWWNASESGRGLLIERSGDKMFMAAFLYDTDGRATWYVASDTMDCATTFSATLKAYGGGQTLGGSHQNASETGTAGTVTLIFSSSSTATMIWPGGATIIERFPIVAGGLTATAPSFQPETGWWWNPAEPGRGFGIEVQGTALMMVGYMYDGSGNPTWFLTQNTMTTSQTYQGALVEYGDGQTLTGTYRSPGVRNAALGTVSLQFDSTTTATLTLPNGRSMAIQRFAFYTPPTDPAIDMPVSASTANVGAITIWPFGTHGSSHALDGHPGWDVEIATGNSIVAPHGGTVGGLYQDSDGTYSFHISYGSNQRYRSDFTNIETLASGIANGASVTAGSALGIPKTRTQFIGSTQLTWAMTHFQFDDMQSNVGITNQFAVFPYNYLSASGRRIFDAMFQRAAYNQELCEPFPYNPRVVTPPLTRTWTLQSGSHAARIDVTCDPVANTYGYAFKDSTGTTTESGTVTLQAVGVTPSRMDLTSSTGAVRRAVWDIACSVMRLDYGAAGATRATGLGNASIYTTSR
jgi:hypothetical protein